MTMQRVRKNNIRWFLDDCAGLAAMVGAIVEGEDSRRSYSILECGEKKAFVKFFLERGAMRLDKEQAESEGQEGVRPGKAPLIGNSCDPCPHGIRHREGRLFHH